MKLTSQIIETEVLSPDCWWSPLLLERETLPGDSHINFNWNVSPGGVEMVLTQGVNNLKQEKNRKTE